MKPQTQLLLLLAYIAAALVMSRCVLAGAGTHAMPVRTVEDDDAGFVAAEEEAAYPQRRVLAYDPGSISYGGLEANKAACYGSCPGRGQPYTGRGCKAIFGCRGR